MKKAILSLITILGLFNLASAQLQWTKQDSVDYQKHISQMANAATEKQALVHFYAASVLVSKVDDSQFELTNTEILLKFFDDVDSISKAKYLIGSTPIRSFDPDDYPHKVWVDGIRNNMQWAVESIAAKALDFDTSLWYELDNRNIGRYSTFVSHLARQQVESLSEAPSNQ